eukprot:scaffold16039_cov57-Phaeocystis_antarctica.AAC.3
MHHRRNVQRALQRAEEPVLCPEPVPPSSPSPRPPPSLAPLPSPHGVLREQGVLPSPLPPIINSAATVLAAAPTVLATARRWGAPARAMVVAGAAVRGRNSAMPALLRRGGKLDWEEAPWPGFQASRPGAGTAPGATGSCGRPRFGQMSPWPHPQRARLQANCLLPLPCRWLCTHRRPSTSNRTRPQPRQTTRTGRPPSSTRRSIAAVGTIAALQPVGTIAAVGIHCIAMPG